MSDTIAESPLSTAMARIEFILVALSAIALAMIMVIVTSDVVLRYIFSSPLRWSYSLISTYLIVIVFFFALSDTLHQHGHIALDILQPLLPNIVKHLSLAVGYGLSTILMALVAWLALDRSIDAWNGDDRIAATIAWPTWIVYAQVAIGSFSMTLRLALRTFGHIASAISGRELVELPPPPETGNDFVERGQ